MKKVSQGLVSSVTLESYGVNSRCESRVACGVASRASGASGVSKGKGKANFRNSRDDND